MLRPLGIFERALVLSDAQSPFNVVTVLRLENPPSPEIVQGALTILQKRHPLLRMVIRDGAFEEASLPKISFEVFDSPNDWLDIVESEMNTRLDTSSLLFRSKYLFHPDRADLILTFHHAIMDAASGMNLLDEILRICSDHDVPPLSTLEVVPPVEEMFPPPFKGLRGAVSMLRYALTQMAEELSYQWQVRGKRKPAMHLGGRGFPLTLVLEEPLVDQLSRRCRAEKVTLNSLLNAVLLLATNLHLYASDERLMQTFSFADLRPYTVPPTPAEDLANYISMLRFTVYVPGKSEIWSLTKDLHDRIYNSLKRGDKFLASKMSESLMKMMIGMKSMRMAASALNYSGAVPLGTQYGGIKVKGLHAFLSSFDLGPEISVQARLFNEELWLDFMFLETDMDRATAEKIAGEVKAILTGAATG